MMMIAYSRPGRIHSIIMSYNAISFCCVAHHDDALFIRTVLYIEAMMSTADDDRDDSATNDQQQRCEQESKLPEIVVGKSYVAHPQHTGTHTNHLPGTGKRNVQSTDVISLSTQLFSRSLALTAEREKERVLTRSRETVRRCLIEFIGRKSQE